MVRRASKKEPASDPNIAAFNVLQGIEARTELTELSEEEQRREAARLLGRLGGSKGGQERARRLSKKRKAEIARQGAAARWKGHKKG